MTTPLGAGLCFVGAFNDVAALLGLLWGWRLPNCQGFVRQRAGAYLQRPCEGSFPLLIRYPVPPLLVHSPLSATHPLNVLDQLQVQQPRERTTQAGVVTEVN